MHEPEEREKQLMVSPKEALARALIVVCATAVTLAVFEITLRLGAFLPEYRLELRGLQGPYRALTIMLDEELLYYVKPNSRPDINALGFRDSSPSPNSPDVCKVVVAGDSFMMSNNVSSGETAPKQLESTLGKQFRVRNHGVSAYGPDQSLLRFRRDVANSKPDVLALVVFAGNDFEDLLKNNIFSASSRGIAISEYNAVTERLPFLRTSMLFRLAFAQTMLAPGEDAKLAQLLVEDDTRFFHTFTEAERRKARSLMQHVLVSWRETTALNNSIPFLLYVIPSWKAYGELLSDTLVEQESHMENVRELQIIAQGIGLEAKAFLPTNTSFAKTTDLHIPIPGLQERDVIYDPAYRHLSVEGHRRFAAFIAPDVRENCSRIK